MESIKEIYKIGNGPSSSHTIGPKRATEDFLKKGKFDFVKVTLFGSLALTGKGHLTDYIVDKTLGDIPHEIIFDTTTPTPHPNTIDFCGTEGDKTVKARYFSIGGGSIVEEGKPLDKKVDIYPFTTFSSIRKICFGSGNDLSDYVYSYEDADIKDYLKKVKDTMFAAIERGITTEGKLPGRLQIDRKAKRLYAKDDSGKNKLFAYAYAVSEENACGGLIVCAPTCGSCGVLPAVVKYSVEYDMIPEDRVIDGLAVAGLIGNIVKENASISGAEAGCQAEVGTACAMAAAYYSYVRGMSLMHIEQAAEIALEHHLGLTCDPIYGYVQIPCIERNAVAASRAVDAFTLARILDPEDVKITFDMVVHTMLETGKDLTYLYRETAIGGLAKTYTE